MKRMPAVPGRDKTMRPGTGRAAVMKRGSIRLAVFMAAGMLLAILAALFVPGPDTHALRARRYSYVIRDRNGAELRLVTLEDGLIREYGAYETIPKDVREVFLASEDKRFFFHPGIDPAAVVRAAWLNLRSGRTVSGASTVTMQLARMVNRHTGGFAGKVTEAVVALRYSLRFSKGEVFSHWISSLPYGSNIEGIASASRVYFGCGPDSLSPLQAAILAVIPRSPSEYDPKANPERLAAHTAQLLERTGRSYNRAEIMNAVKTAAEHRADWTRPFLAPHFCDRVERLAVGADRRLSAPVRTTLDLEAQRLLEHTVVTRVFDAAEYRITNGAAVAIDPRSGEIIAWVGSASYFSAENLGMNDGVLARRQPGSTLKPFLYELALERGFTASDILPDIPFEFGTGELYMPSNFNNRFNGPVRLRVALASSLNVPAVYLLSRIGVANFCERLLSLGFESLEGRTDGLGLSLALGGAEVTLLELVNAYCAFAADGVLKRPVFLADGSEAPRQKRVMDPVAVSIIRDILTDPVSRYTGFGRGAAFDTVTEAMFKTGTSNQFNNIWAVGVSPEIAVGVWMGNFGGETVIGVPGASLPASAAAEFLRHLGGTRRFEPDRALVMREVCALSGRIAGPYCTATVPERFRPDRLPELCGFHTAAGVTLPPEYGRWLAFKGLEARADAVTGEGVRILSPIREARFSIDPYVPAVDQRVAVEAVSGRGRDLTLFLDGEPVASGGVHLLYFAELERGTHTVTVSDGTETDSVRYTVE